MQQLSGLDASFLYLETSEAPMHIGGVAILDPSTAPGGRFELGDLRRLLQARLHLSRTFTQKLVEVPLSLGNPYWIEDEDFDIDRHLERTQLPEPGGWKELSALVAWEFSRPLERDKPLWELVFVEGLDTVAGMPPGAVGLISKIHHAAIDGISGSEIMSALYDTAPEPRPVPAPEPKPPEPAPRKTDLLKNVGKHLRGAPRELGAAVGETVQGLVRSGAAWGVHKVKPPPFPFTAPRTRFNVPVTHERVWGAALLSLERIKAIRMRTECTVNDVVLTICAGALRRYLDSHGELPEKPLVAMVPVSVRSDEERRTMGNQVSAMLVALATDIDDPRERLRLIREGATGSKVHHRAIGARTLVDYAELIPFALGGLGSRLYSRMSLAEKHRPIFNLVITNVPGPQMPLYVGGAKLLAQVGAAPVLDGMGLILPIFSYNGTLAIGVTACRKVLPDAEAFTGYLEDALGELETALAEGAEMLQPEVDRPE